MARRALRDKPSADRILTAAETLFANKGYGEVSLRQLIAAAGVSTTAFYARFDSKASVLDTLTERLFAELQLEAAMELRNVRDFATGIERGVDILCARFGPRKALVRLVVAESGSLAPMLSTRRKSYAMLAGFLAHYFKLLADRGRITVADPNALAWALVGALEIQIVRWAVWDELELDQLRDELLAVTRAILPKEKS
ncbi:MAG TPA: TetR/AcrR family transcriptional regulator [Kofleriaceae bacterium]|nr:TetR/AcrR family transcriptional regulator [Kofleriaceae bacterium]